MKGKGIKKMKRLFAILLALTLTLSMFAACDGDDTADTNAGENEGTNAPAENEGKEPAETDAEVSGKEYVFVSGSVTVKMNVPAEDILAALGEAKSEYEAPSCAFQGNDYYYDYGSFELSAYDNGDGVKMVYSIYLKDDLVETPEGLMIGSDEADVVSLYGAEGKQENGSYLFTDGNANLSVIIKDGKVSAIEYTAVVK